MLRERRTIKGCFYIKIAKSSWSAFYGNGSGLAKSSAQSESKTVNGFTFTVLGKAAEGQYRHTLRGGFFQKCLKSSPGRGLIIFFPNILLSQQKSPYGVQTFSYYHFFSSDNAPSISFFGKKII